MRYLPLFPMSVWKGNIENNDELKEVLLPFINETKDTLEKPNGWGTNKVVTSFGNNKVNELLISNERQKVQDAYWNKLDEVFSLNPINSAKHNWDGHILPWPWFNYYVDGEWQEKHNHLNPPNLPRCDFSAIHFVSWDKDKHVPIRFHDPMRNLKEVFSNHTHYAEWSPTIEEGDFIVFPSYLEHNVPAQPLTLDYPRITISFNMAISFI